MLKTELPKAGEAKTTTPLDLAKEVAAKLSVLKLTDNQAVAHADQFLDTHITDWPPAKKLYLGLWLKEQQITMHQDELYPERREFYCRLLKDTLTETQQDSLATLFNKLTAIHKFFFHTTYSAEIAKICRVVVTQNKWGMAREARKLLEVLAQSNSPELQYHAVQGLQDKTRIQKFATGNPPAFFRCLLDDTLVSAREKIDCFYDSRWTETPRSFYWAFEVDDLAKLGQVYIAALPPKPGLLVSQAKAFLHFFIEQAKIAHKSAGSEEKQPAASREATICIQVIEAMAQYWSTLYLRRGADSLPLHTTQDAHSEIAVALLRCAPYTQTHTLDARGKTAIMYEEPGSERHTLLQTHGKLADLADLGMYVTDIDENQIRLKDRYLLRMEAYLEVLQALARCEESKDEVLCRAELAAILQSKIAAEQVLATSGWRVLQSDKPSTFIEILEGMLANLNNLWPQYQKFQGTFKDQIEVTQGRITESKELPPAKSTAGIKETLLAQFLSHKESQITTPQKAAKELFFREFAMNHWQGDKLRDVFRQLHPALLAEIYQNQMLRGKIEPSYWLELAVKPGNAALADVVFTQVMQEIDGHSPRPQSVSVGAQTADHSPLPQRSSGEEGQGEGVNRSDSQLAEVKSAPPINAESLADLAIATGKSAAVKTCLQKFNNPHDPLYSPVTADIYPTRGPAASCYDFLSSASMPSEDWVPIRYEMACYRSANYLKYYDASIVQKYCDQAAAYPELLAAAIAKRLLATPRGRACLMMPPEVLRSQIQTELESDPGYQALIRRIDKYPMMNLIPVYQLCERLGLKELGVTQLMGNPNFDTFSQEEIALLNNAGIAKLLIELMAEGIKLQPAEAIQIAQQCLGDEGADWTRIQKLYLGLWLKDCDYPTFCGNPRDHSMFKSRWNYAITAPSSWAFSKLACAMLHQTMFDCAQADLPTLFAKLSGVLGFFHHNVTADAIVMCRKVMMRSPELLREARMRLQTIDPDEGAVFGNKGWSLSTRTHDINVAYQRALGILEAGLESKTDKLDAALLSSFIRSEAKYKSKPEIAAASDQAAATEQKRPEESEPTPAKTLSQQLVEMIIAEPAHWGYLCTPDKHGQLPVHAAAEVKSEAVDSLLQIAPYTQNHSGKKSVKSILFPEEKAGSVVANLLQKFFSWVINEKYADLVDFKIYIDSIIVAKAGMMQDDRRSVRGKAYVELLELLENLADSPDSPATAEQITRLVDQHIVAEQKVSNKWYRANASESNSTFMGILEGLKLNSEHLLPQYRQFRATFKGYVAAVKPMVEALQPKKPATSSNPPRFSLTARPSSAVEDDDMDGDIQDDLTRSNRGGARLSQV